MTLIKAVNLLATICGGAMLTYGIYYALIALNFIKKKTKYPEAKKLYKFAVLIAARNEENVIGEIIDSLKGQNYPKELYDIIVMPNNCTDKTKEKAIEHGAMIIEPTKTVTNKGDVLHQTFDILLKDYDHDAYIIFDADNIVDENYISEMNKALNAGNQAAIGYRDSKNPTSSYLSGAYTLYYMTVTTFFNRARSNIGMNSMITGTGFMTSRSNMVKLGGWNTSTLTEDIEFTLQNCVAGTHIEYVPDAITYDDIPDDFSVSWNQRLRWAKGSMQNTRLMAKPLMKSVVNGKGKNSLDMFIMLLAAYMQIFGFFASVVGILAVFLLDAGIIKYLMRICLTGFLAQTFISIVLLLYYKKPILKMWKGIIYYPVFTVTWLPIIVVAIYKDNVEWKEIKHKAIAEY